MQNAAAICNPKLLLHFAAIKISLPGTSCSSPVILEGWSITANTDCTKCFWERKSTLHNISFLLKTILAFFPAEAWDCEYRIQRTVALIQLRVMNWRSSPHCELQATALRRATKWDLGNSSENLISTPACFSVGKQYVCMRL